MNAAFDKDKEIKQDCIKALEGYLKAKPGDRLWCFTDPARLWLAEGFCQAAQEMGCKASLFLFSTNPYEERDIKPLAGLLRELSKDDIILAVFSEEIGKTLPYWRLFPTFKSPEGFSGRSGVVRPRWPGQTIGTALGTSPDAAMEATRNALLLNDGLAGMKRGTPESKDTRRIRVTAPGGTDITFRPRGFKVLPFMVEGDQRHAYLPPSEAYTGIVEGSASGTVVVDVTVGEFVVKGEIIDPLGLVDEPVTLEVRDGYVTSVSGGEMALRLQACFDRYDQDYRLVVELGVGLSDGDPTGFISADECLRGTAHSGIGGDLFYGGSNKVPMHLDVVFKGAKIELI